MGISVCIIAKDEEAFLPACLESVRSFAQEVIVVDTGSTDRTPQLAEEAGARVLHHPWEGDFSAARNRALDAASGDWILVLDADERVFAEDVPLLLGAVGGQADGYFLKCINYVDLAGRQIMDEAQVFRLFRNRPDWRFHGRVHEQVLDRVTSSGGKVGLLGVRLAHFGYVDEVLNSKRKPERNLELLGAELQQRPDDPYLYLQQGREYQRLGQPARAIAAYREALKKPLIITASYRSVAYHYLATALLQVPDIRSAVQVLDEGLGYYPEWADLYFLRGEALAHAKQWPAAVENYLLAILHHPYPSVHFYQIPHLKRRAMHRLAQSFLATDRQRDALAVYKRLVDDDPTDVQAVQGLAQVLLAQKMNDGQVQQAVLRFLPQPLHPAHAESLGNAFQAARRDDLAGSFFRQAWERGPNEHLRMVLAESMLFSGDVTGAEAMLAGGPNSLLRNRLLLRLYLQQGRLEEAEALLAAIDDEAIRSALALLVAVRRGDAERIPTVWAEGFDRVLLGELATYLRSGRKDLFDEAILLLTPYRMEAGLGASQLEMLLRVHGHGVEADRYGAVANGRQTGQG